ncbi:MAG: CinA family nicotinamide mononucleotide deamidase-related protein [Bacteroidales bacterium]|nr:CinA family nicotinamide mononucleotide deamidase-related protein [Bacteroidales bacterium]
MITASICTIGDEILIGQIVDTNSSDISRELNRIGVKVVRMLSIGDDHREIVDNLNACLATSDVVLVTGGLGPTKDDITKEALRELSGSAGWRKSEEQYEVIDRILTARGIKMLDTNQAQALVPDKCEVIVNKLGTAPCMAFHGLGPDGSASLYSMPGVPFETRGLLGDVMDDIRAHYKLEKISHRTIVTFGIPESELAKQIESWEDSLPANMHLAYLPNPTIGVRLRLSAFGVETDFAQQVEELRGLLGDAIYGEGEDTLPVAIGRMLRERGAKMAAAESCTGGRISELMTAVAGCSDYYNGSVTSYANSVKMGTLGVREETLAQHGAVSEETVREMAAGVLRKLDTDYSVATSGIAGPGGATPGKPVGMAWLAAAHRNADGEISVTTKCVKFSSSRAVNIERFASNALNLLRLKILAGD